jgi:plasmid maintenance system antidote protein VapI
MKDFIQQHLHKNQMSQRTLAKRMNLDPAAICYMLNGKRHLKAIEVIELANILNINPLEILKNLKENK